MVSRLGTVSIRHQGYSLYYASYNLELWLLTQRGVETLS